MDLSIIIINWNSKDFVAACLRSIFRHAPEVAFEIIVLDSGSFDGCGEMITKDFPGVRFIQADENLGFARANNLAVQSAVGHVLLFLNPDTELHTGAADAMYEVCRNVPDSGAVGARLLNSDGSLQTSCVQAFPTILNQVICSDALIRTFPESSLWGKAALFQHGSDSRGVDAVSGAALMMRRELFGRVGGFCEDYFMYSEDIDICFKATAIGFRSRYVPVSVITHHGGGSSSRQPSRISTIMTIDAVRLFFVRHVGVAYAAMFRAVVAASAAVRLFLLVILRLTPRLRRATNITVCHSFSKWKTILLWALGWTIERRSLSEG